MPTTSEPCRYARLTPPGEGGVGKLLIWGPGATATVGALFEGRRELSGPGLYHGRLVQDGATVDDVLLEWTSDVPPSVKLSTHGGERPVARVEQALRALGARAGHYEEYVAARVASGRTDRPTEEARLALIGAVTELAIEAALTQLDGAFAEQLDRIARCDGAPALVEQLYAAAPLGRALFEPRRLLLVGATNAGKSALFNRLAGDQLALVSDAPDATRDYLTTPIFCAGLPFELVDTPACGERTQALWREADRLLLVLAPGAEAPAWVRGRPGLLPLWNKSDLSRPTAEQAAQLRARWGREPLPVSAATGDGLERLRHALVEDLAEQLALGVRRAIPVSPAQWALCEALHGAVESQAVRSILADRVNQYLDGWE